MMKQLLVVLAAFLVLPSTMQAQSAADSAAIVQTALDYIEGYYTGDGERMEGALHPELSKRIVLTEPSSGQSQLRNMTAQELVAATASGYGTRTPEAERQMDVTILDIFENAASVKIVAHDWIDYLHIGKYDDKWVIVNVLWEFKPEALERMRGGG